MNHSTSDLHQPLPGAEPVLANVHSTFRIYLQPGDVVEATSVSFIVNEKGNGLADPSITDAAELKFWNEQSERWHEVKWDFNTHPARLYYDNQQHAEIYGATLQC
jgi:hypothetical protein